MKKLIYLLVFCPFLGFSQDATIVDCDANDVKKEIYQQEGYIVMKCTDKDGDYVLNVVTGIPGSSGGASGGGASGGVGGGGGNGVDTGMSEPPGPEGSGSSGGCINTWIKDNGQWQQTAYCGG